MKLLFLMIMLMPALGHVQKALLAQTATPPGSMAALPFSLMVRVNDIFSFPVEAPPAQCGPAVPPEFVSILSKLDTPIRNVEAGALPVELPPAVASELPHSPPSRATAFGITVYNGAGDVKQGDSREGGVKVFRGPVNPQP